MNKIKFFKAKRLGFSLVELLVVIAIIGISSGIVLKGFDSDQKIETELEVEGLKLSAIIAAQKNDALSGKITATTPCNGEYIIRVNDNNLGYTVDGCNPMTQELKSGVMFSATSAREVTFKAPFAKAFSGGNPIAPGAQVDFVLTKEVDGVAKNYEVSVFGNGIITEAAVVPPISTDCTLPWGGTIADGLTATAYTTGSVPCASTCSGETKTCTGALPIVFSASYTFQSCDVDACPADTTAPVTTASPVEGTYATAQSVTLSCSDSDSGCGNTYYTTNGSDPTTASTVYSGAISISSTTTLKYFSVDNATPANNEAVKTATYTIDACGGVTSVAGKGADTNTYGTVKARDGRCWLSTNLGVDVSKLPIITSKDDPDGLGWYYQWGRGTDGHQIRTSGTTSTLSSSDTPGHGRFITTSSTPHDWRSPQNNSLWQGVNGVNNPCPTGFRLPIMGAPAVSEWKKLADAEGIVGLTTAFNSTLKITGAGYRQGNAGGIISNTDNEYWSSSYFLSGGFYYGGYAIFDSLPTEHVATYSQYGTKGNGMHVRCIKD